MEESEMQNSLIIAVESSEQKDAVQPILADLGAKLTALVPTR
jgi:hypothetical protein